MSNIYLQSLQFHHEDIPTPRLRSLLKTGTVTITDQEFLAQEIAKGAIPLYKIKRDLLYKSEKSFLKRFSGKELFFCFPMLDSARAEPRCDIDQQRIEEMFDLKLREDNFQCIRFTGRISTKKIGRFCQIYDKTFHFVNSLMKVMETGQYELTTEEKEIFSSAFMRILAFSNIRLRLDCDKNIQNIKGSYPLWLQQFAKGIIILDVPNDMVANSLISHAVDFIAKAYSDLKFVSLSICHRFLLNLRKHPDYEKNKIKIEEWLDICKNLMTKNKKDQWVPLAMVAGLLTAIVLLKAIGRSGND